MNNFEIIDEVNSNLDEIKSLNIFVEFCSNHKNLVNSKISSFDEKNKAHQNFKEHLMMLLNLFKF